MQKQTQKKGENPWKNKYSYEEEISELELETLVHRDILRNMHMQPISP